MTVDSTLLADLQEARDDLQRAREVAPINPDAVIRKREHVARVEKSVRYLERLVELARKEEAA